MVTSVLSDDQLGAIHLLLDRIRARQLRDFGQIGSDVKPDGSLITDCDRWSDAALVEGLASISPGEGVLSEEGSKTVPNTRAYWGGGSLGRDHQLRGGHSLLGDFRGSLC